MNTEEPDKNEIIRIITIEDNDKKKWFSAAQVTKTLGYTNTKRVIRLNVSPENKKKLKEIVNNPNETHKNAQPYAIFINQSGLGELVSKSSQKKAVDLRKSLLVCGIKL